MRLIRILLVDDSPEFLDAAVRFLSSEPQFSIVGTAYTGADALDQINKVKPDLVLMDLALPGVSGLEITRIIKAQSISPKVIILTLHDSVEYRTASETVSADGFLAKSDFGVSLLPLIYALFEEVLVEKTIPV